jgi:hypothetical protein
MPIINFELARAEIHRKRAKVQKMLRKHMYRLLRTAGPFIAQQMYHCDYCICPILAGDHYEREIYVNSQRFWTKRKHHPDCFAPTEEEVNEVMEEMEHEREAEQQETFSECA